jgi:hypothetical protein
MTKKLIRKMPANLSDGSHRIKLIADRLAVKMAWRLMEWVGEEAEG